MTEPLYPPPTRRIAPRGPFSGARLLLADNGWGWAVLYAFQVVTRWTRLRRIASLVDQWMGTIEHRRGLPGLHSVARNYREWQLHDWSEGGEEWSPSPQWKRSLIEHVLLRLIPPDRVVMEIGPGAGRWSTTLADISAKLILVDISDRCIAACRNRLRERSNVQYIVNDGASLGSVASGTIDRIWSFDVFVHICPRDTESYLKEFSRVLSKGGLAVIHHPNRGSRNDGWRSRTTSQMIRQMAEANELVVLEQFNSWDQGFDVRFHDDMITVLQRP